jgi:hypothetical protein
MIQVLRVHKIHGAAGAESGQPDLNFFEFAQARVIAWSKFDQEVDIAVRLIVTASGGSEQREPGYVVAAAKCRELLLIKIQHKSIIGPL